VAYDAWLRDEDISLLLFEDLTLFHPVPAHVDQDQARDHNNHHRVLVPDLPQPVHD